jgi:hypothetical protein
MTQFNLPPTRHPTTHFLTVEKTLTNGMKCCFLSPVRDENHAHNEDAEARAGHWLHGQLAALLPSFGRRGIEIIDNQGTISKTRDCQSIAGFSLFDPKPK